MTNPTTPLPVQEPAGAVEAIMALADAYAEAAQRGEDAMSIARKCSALRSALASLQPVTQAPPDVSIPGPGMNASGERVDSANVTQAKSEAVARAAEGVKAAQTKIADEIVNYGRNHERTIAERVAFLACVDRLATLAAPQEAVAVGGFYVMPGAARPEHRLHLQIEGSIHRYVREEAVERQPLTDLQIADCATDLEPYPMELVCVPAEQLIAFVRNIEAALGIGPATQEKQHG